MVQETRPKPLDPMAGIVRGGLFPPHDDFQSVNPSPISDLGQPPAIPYEQPNLLSADPDTLSDLLLLPLIRLNRTRCAVRISLC